MAPTPHRPIHVAGATRPARMEGPECQVAGGGTLGGTHRLHRGPIYRGSQEASGSKVGHALRARDPGRLS